MSDNSLYNEQEILLQISLGKSEAFTLLVNFHWKRVYGHALAYSKSITVAEEVTQDVFMDVWNSREKLPTIDNFANFLYIITRNRIFKVLRQKLSPHADALIDHLQEDIWLPHQQLEYNEMHKRVLEAVAQLPSVRRKVFEMSRFDKLSYEEIGAALGISRNTVKEHIVKALQYIRQYLAAAGLYQLLFVPSLARLFTLIYF